MKWRSNTENGRSLINFLLISSPGFTDNKIILIKTHPGEDMNKENEKVLDFYYYQLLET